MSEDRKDEPEMPPPVMIEESQRETEKRSPSRNTGSVKDSHQIDTHKPHDEHVQTTVLAINEKIITETKITYPTIAQILPVEEATAQRIHWCGGNMNSEEVMAIETPRKFEQKDQLACKARQARANPKISGINSPVCGSEDSVTPSLMVEKHGLSAPASVTHYRKRVARKQGELPIADENTGEVLLDSNAIIDCDAGIREGDQFAANAGHRLRDNCGKGAMDSMILPNDSLPPANDSYDDDLARIQAPSLDGNEVQPGAYRAQGRAYGALPAWGRQNATLAAGNRLDPSNRSTSRRLDTWIRNQASTRRIGSFLSTINSHQTDLSLVEADLVNEAETVVYASGVVPDNLNQTKRRFYCVFVALGLLIVALAIGLSVSEIRQSNNPSAVANIDRRCLLSVKEQSVFAHCKCRQTAEFLVLSDNETLMYNSVGTLLLNENVTSKAFERSSCDLENQALLWVANYERLRLSPKELVLTRPRIIIQRFVVALFFLALEGDNWTNNDGWMEDPYVCNWFGLQCRYLESISEISLPRNNLRGKLSSQIGRMPFLRILDIPFNYITGTVSGEIAHSASLHEINVRSNLLNGTISSTYLNSSVLDKLIFSNNSLSGVVATDISGVSRMRQLSFDRNRIEGTIPTAIGLLTNLEILELNDNMLSGSIPTELSALKFLEQLDLHDNLLTGKLPLFFGENDRLDTIFVFENKLTGTVPQIFCRNNTTGLASIMVANCKGTYSIDPNCTCCGLFVQCFEDLSQSLILQLQLLL